MHQKLPIKLNLLKPLKSSLSPYTLEGLFKSLVRSSLEYADVVWDGCNCLLESLQIEGACKRCNRRIERDEQLVYLS